MIIALNALPSAFRSKRLSNSRKVPVGLVDALRGPSKTRHSHRPLLRVKWEKRHASSEKKLELQEITACERLTRFGAWGRYLDLDRGLVIVASQPYFTYICDGPGPTIGGWRCLAGICECTIYSSSACKL